MKKARIILKRMGAVLLAAVLSLSLLPEMALQSVKGEEVEPKQIQAGDFAIDDVSFWWGSLDSEGELEAVPIENGDTINVTDNIKAVYVKGNISYPDDGRFYELAACFSDNQGHTWKTYFYPVKDGMGLNYYAEPTSWTQEGETVRLVDLYISDADSRNRCYSVDVSSEKYQFEFNYVCGKQGTVTSFDISGANNADIENLNVGDSIHFSLQLTGGTFEEGEICEIICYARYTGGNMVSGISVPLVYHESSDRFEGDYLVTEESECAWFVFEGYSLEGSPTQYLHTSYMISLNQTKVFGIWKGGTPDAILADVYLELSGIRYSVTVPAITTIGEIIDAFSESTGYSSEKVKGLIDESSGTAFLRDEAVYIWGEYALVLYYKEHTEADHTWDSGNRYFNEQETGTEYTCTECGKKKHVRDESFTSLAQASDGNWYDYVDGIVSMYTGLRYYNGSWWYIEEGEVNFGATTLCQYNGTWWYVEKGKVNFNATTLCLYNGTWWYIQKGKVNFGATTLCNYGGTWWYVEKGKVNFNATTLCQYGGSWWYVQKGKVNFGATTLCLYNGTWWYVQKGKVNFGATTLCQYGGSWWNVEKGKVNFNATTLCNYGGKWWYVQKGKVNFGATTLCKYNGTWWYVEKGAVNFNYTGYFKYYGTNYRIVKGIVKF